MRTGPLGRSFFAFSMDFPSGRGKQMFTSYNTLCLKQRYEERQQMKKIFVAACSAALVLGLAGCGSQPAQEEQPEEEYQQVEGLTDEESVAKARALLEGLFSAPAEQNSSEVQVVNTATDVDGETYDNVQTTTIMRDITDGASRFYIRTETNPASEADATYYIDGTQGIKEMGEDRAAVEFDQSYIDSLTNPDQDNANARTYMDCAEQISYYEQDGKQAVKLTVDPAKLMASGIFADTYSSISECVAEYTFNADGKLNTFLSTIKGDTIGVDGTDIPTTVEIKCVYFDYGTTEVPALPEPTDGTAEGASTDQAEGTPSEQ